MSEEQPKVKFSGLEEAKRTVDSLHSSLEQVSTALADKTRKKLFVDTVVAQAREKSASFDKQIQELAQRAFLRPERLRLLDDVLEANKVLAYPSLRHLEPREPQLEELKSLVEKAQDIDETIQQNTTVQMVLNYAIAEQINSQRRSQRRWNWATIGLSVFAILISIAGIALRVL